MSNVPNKEEKSRAWTPEQLADHIRKICGEVVADALKPLQKRITDYGNTFENDEEKRVRMARERATGDPMKQKAAVLGGIMGAVALAGKGGDLAMAIVRAKEIAVKTKDDSVVKALESSTATSGGVLIPIEISQDFIDLLTAKAIVRSFGVPTVTMDNGIMQINRLSQASTAFYIGENRDATISQEAFDMKQLSAKKLAVMVPLSNDLIRRGGPQVNSIVRNDSLRAAKLKEDLVFIRSQGSQFAPKGLRYQAATNSVFDANATVNLVNVTTDLGNMVLKLEEANVGMTNVGWMCAPRTKQYLMTVRDSLGNYAFRPELLTGNLWGWPLKTTTQIPKNLGAGNMSEMYLTDFDEVVIGDTLMMEIAVSTEAAYIDENGNLVSAFSRDQSVIRMLVEHDLVARHDEAISVLTSVTWGS